jgi:hypothetical protein
MAITMCYVVRWSLRNSEFKTSITNHKQQAQRLEIECQNVQQ